MAIPVTYPSFLRFLRDQVWKAALTAAAPWIEVLTGVGLMSEYFQLLAAGLATAAVVLSLVVSFTTYRRASDKRCAKALKWLISITVATLMICLVYRLMVGSTIVPPDRFWTEFTWASWIGSYVVLFFSFTASLAIAGLRAMR